MRLAILIPSRNRPRMLSAAITALHEMESGENEVEYRVGYDLDDDATRIALMDLPAHAVPTAEETPTIGGIWNNLAQWNEADIYSCMIDDAFPISPHWDTAMVAMAKKHKAFSWFEVSAPTNVGYPTCTKEWLKSCGYIVPEYYPFWFSDTHFCEMVWFVTNDPVTVSHSMSLFSKQEATQNLRDLSFWWGFFNATRPIRLKEAYKMLLDTSMSFEDFTKSRAKWIKAGNARDSEFYGKRIEQLEAAKASKEPPSERYLKAKKNAEDYLKNNNLTLWNNLC